MATKENTGHTPGPWAWMRGAERGWRLHAGPPDGRKTLIMVSGSRGGTLKDVPSYANARLIALAPELVVALRELKYASEHARANHYQSEFGLRAAEDRASALLAEVQS